MVPAAGASPASSTWSALSLSPPRTNTQQDMREGTQDAMLSFQILDYKMLRTEILSFQKMMF
jgi:hypothetical protein